MKMMRVLLTMMMKNEAEVLPVLLMYRMVIEFSDGCLS